MTKSLFVCQQCGNEFYKWMGKCSYCGEWNSLVETVVGNRTKINSKNKQRTNLINSDTKPIKLSEVKLTKSDRNKTDISELDRVLGGGLVNGQVVLIAGEPGIGKSTLLMQLSNNLKNVFYVSGEESSSQVALRAKRLGVNNKEIVFFESTDCDDIVQNLNNLKEKPRVVIIDSIQTMVTQDLTGLAGSVGQVRETASRFLKYAKQNDAPLVIVGHVTKEGTVAGPSVLAHIVDTILWFEGEKTSNLRLLRSVKNRFGSTDEVGIFQMEESGLSSVTDAEKIFLDKKNDLSVAGSTTSILMEGTRSILVEIQSLVVPTKMAFPRRVAQGIDSKRLEMLLAILYRRAGISTFEMDVFVNVAGGIKAKDTSLDLAICLSIASSFYDKALPKNILAIGEVGLLGEIRNVNMQEKRVKDAKRLGFNDPVSSKDNKYLNQVIKKYLR